MEKRAVAPDIADPADLRERISDAFDARGYPGDGNIGINTPNCEWYEGEVLARFFRQRDWRTLCFDQMLQSAAKPHASVPAFLTVEAFAYYLPAFLTMALDIRPEDNSLRQQHLWTFADSVCFGLTPPDPDRFDRQYAELRDSEDVPAEVKDMLRYPTPEAQAAEQILLENHLKLIEELDNAERSAVRAALEYLAEIFRDAVMDDAYDADFNSARRALATTWGRFPL